MFSNQESILRTDNCAQVKSKSTGSIFVVAESRLSQLPKDKAKTENAPSGPFNDAKNAKPKSKGASSEKTKKPVDDGCYEVLERVKGSALVGMK